jgi:hypothetical protein
MLAIGQEIKAPNGKEYTITGFIKSESQDGGNYKDLYQILYFSAERDGIACKLKITFDEKNAIKKVIEQ